MSRADADAVIARTGGDPRLIEKELAFDAGYLGDKPELIAIHDVSGLRMPSGNEVGAYDGLWRPGGYTGGGVREAAIDPTPPSAYSVHPIPRVK